MVAMVRTSKKKPIKYSPETMVDKGLARFFSRHKTESDFLKFLARSEKKTQKTKCLKCKSKDIIKMNRGRVLFCRNCRKKTWTTANTFFHGIHNPRAWAAAIHLTEQGIVVSGNMFAEKIGMSSSAASEIFQKLTTTIIKRMNGNSLLHSANFRDVYCKRSLATPAFEHPSAEQDAIEQEELENIKHEKIPEDSKAIPPELNAVERTIFEVLSSSPQAAETLYSRAGVDVQDVSIALAMMELAGHIKSLPGDIYSLVENDRKPIQNISPSEIQLDEMVNAFLSFIKAHFHGISRKYCQGYWALFLFVNLPPNLRNLVEICNSSDPIKRDDLRSYVTPMEVKVFTLACPQASLL